MAKEIIDAIRQAETEAVKTVAAAEREAEEIVQQAQEKAAEVKKEMTKQAREKAAEEAAAREECGRMLEDAGKQEKEEGIRLEAAMADKRRQAVEAVLAELM